MNKIKKLLLVVGATLLLIPAVVGTTASKKNHIVLTKYNTLVLNSVVDDSSVGVVMEKAKELDSYSSLIHGRGPIYLFLNTPGGSIQAGLSLIDTLNGLDRKIDTITMFAASMGFQIAQSMQGDRLILENGVLMSHHAYGGSEGEFGGQEPSQLRNRLGLWERRVLELDMQTVKRTKGKQTLQSYQAAYNKELWLTGTQSVEQGYADNIVTISCDKTLDGFTHHVVEFMGLRIGFDQSLCPTNQGLQNIALELATTKGVMEYNQFIKNHGVFGEACLMRQGEMLKPVCALDTTLNPEKLEKIKTLFIEHHEEKQRQVIDKF